MPKKKIFNSRAFISLSIFLTFTLLTVTSLLMFANRHTELIAMLHTLVGFAVLSMVLWHVKNNILALLQYVGLRRQTQTTFALPAAVLLVACLTGLSLARLPPLETFYQWGNALRARDKTEQDLKFSYVRITNSPADAQGKTLTIDLRKGPYFMFPQYAIWLENMDGSLIQPLYVTQKLAHNSFTNKVTKRNKNQVFTSNPLTTGQDSEEIFHFEVDAASAEQRFRPESLPVFLHKLINSTPERVFAAKINNKAAMPGSTLTSSPSLAAGSNLSSNNLPSNRLASNTLPVNIDAYSGATLLDNFLLETRTRKPLPDSYRLRLEINQSFDFNTYYSSNRFADDPVYSGNGYSAQPSVVYEAVIDSHSSQRFYPMQLVGHGHHSGMDGEIYRDMTNFTTATQLIDRVIIEVGDD